MNGREVLRDQVARLVRALQASAWAGAAGVALLAFAFAFGHAARTEQEAARAALARERASLLHQATQPGAARRSDRENLLAFYRRFPPAGELPARLALLHRLAADQGVALARADYRISPEPGTPLQRVALGLPVRGAFAPVHGWLAEVFREMPEVALESLSLKREATEAAELALELRINLYVRAEP
ncbi:MAG: hypothetical protein RBS40_08960 [Rhodocyclaceae bacterium]|jgi:hypothetical protein|nr:hypothetical protein [Rhodocyclaceae bacterium]